MNEENKEILVEEVTKEDAISVEEDCTGFDEEE